MTKEEIGRINTLAKKAKTPEGLTEAEKEEQKVLRGAYVAAVKRNLQEQLEHTWVVDASGHKRKLTGGKS
jgi:uncharacterized protein YnzC (UPF0291/DUF896 family)